MRTRDVIVVGGGPAGLAAAAGCARRGLDVLVLEARGFPVDKACGEGLMPPGVRALEALGALRHVAAADRAPFNRIRWIAEDGAVAEADLGASGGLGIRRTALSAALAIAASGAGAELREHALVRSHLRSATHVEVVTDAGEERAKFLVAADGLGSSIRSRERLDAPARGPRRFGLRRHYAVAPWVDAVEVHFSEGVEAYVTPAGKHRVGVAFLCEDAARADWTALLARFPALRERLDGAPYDSQLAGAGPFARACRARARDRLALLGDSAGYVDALTGEGVSLALQAASALVAVLPEAIAAGGAQATLAPFEHAAERRFRRYSKVARFTLAIARHPALRRGVLTEAARHPRLFSRVVAWAVE